MKEFDSQIGEQRTPEASFWLKTVVAGFVCLAIVFHLGLAAKGLSLYRGQHLGTALEYAKGKIDLLHPVIVGFNATETPMALEIPIWQASAAVLFKCFGPWFGWANVASLVFMMGALWPLFQIAKNALGVRGAWWALVFFTAQPLVFFESGNGSTDGSCLTFMIWFLFFADKMVQSGQFKWFFPAMLFGALSATSKMPFFFCAGLNSFFLLLVHFRKSLRRWMLLSAVGLLVTVIFMAWTHHTDRLSAQAEFPYCDTRISAHIGGLTAYWWYFGDLAYRLSPGVWGKAGWRFLNAEFGSMALVGFSLAGIFLLRSTLIRCWFLAAAVTTLVFTHLILHHVHYYIMLSPPIAIAGAAAFSRLEIGLKDNWPEIARWIPLGTWALLMLALAQGLIGMKIVLYADPYPKYIAAQIQEHTSPTDKILIYGGDWGGAELFLSDRKGLSIWNTAVAEDPQKLNRLRELGYTKLVMINESPLLTALEGVNPGLHIRRASYRVALTPTAEHWPTAFQNDDILIKDIPAAAH
jgi:hypothetical protein